jgi:FdhD protein
VRISEIDVTRIARGEASRERDAVVIEEPLEIRVDDRPISVTLRTPGDDFDLAAGFLFTESIVRESNDVESIRHWGSPNVVRVGLRDGVRVDWQRLQRHFYSTSSCGVCGKTSIDAIRVFTSPLPTSADLAADAIVRMPDTLRAQQTTFDATGGIHAAGIFDANGTLLRAREDVGRHNAVDKVIGSFFREGIALNDHVLVVSGRASFEIVQKAVVARLAALVAVGAPSSLAIELAREMNLALYGFVREGRLNVY